MSFAPITAGGMADLHRQRAESELNPDREAYDPAPVEQRAAVATAHATLALYYRAEDERRSVSSEASPYYDPSTGRRA